MIVRPSFTLGGSGGGIAYNREELMEFWPAGSIFSPVHEVLIEESVLGWKEYELEVMRDLAGQRHHHLLDRKLRSHGRAYRRFDHRRSGADAYRSRVSGDARCRDRGDPRDRRGDRRIEHSVRCESRRLGAWSSSR